MSRRTASKLLSGIPIGGQIFEHNINILIGIILQIAIQDNRIDPESLQRADSELPDSLRFAGRKKRKAVIISGAAFWKSQLMKKHIR